MLKAYWSRQEAVARNCSAMPGSCNSLDLGKYCSSLSPYSTAHSSPPGQQATTAYTIAAHAVLEARVALEECCRSVAQAEQTQKLLYFSSGCRANESLEHIFNSREARMHLRQLVCNEHIMRCRCKPAASDPTRGIQIHLVSGVCTIALTLSLLLT